ncbi:MAG: sulfite exporter TauE/SafE family protein [Rubrivivax sp.]|nr:MAG: sulfite exporter TauE/SafE family protein [Rubrivivax sp.]
MPWDLVLLVGVSLAAGFVDAIVGGGGLLTVPALFSIYPSESPATLLGTNKGAALCGTSLAARQYAARVQLDLNLLWRPAVLALLGSGAGAWLVTVVPPDGLRRLMPVILLLVLVYTIRKKDFGVRSAPVMASRGRQHALASAIGLLVGLYDGFFGPGTGSFFMFLFVKLLGYDFMQASASAKVLNVATNLAAIAVFSASGHVNWPLVAVMGAANIAGSWMGSRTAMRKGVGFVRDVFILVVSALLVKTAYTAFA